MKNKSLAILLGVLVSIVGFIHLSITGNNENYHPNNFHKIIAAIELCIICLTVIYLLFSVIKFLINFFKRIVRDELTKREKWLWLLSIAVLFVWLIIYWNAIRPSTIKQDCYNSAIRYGSKYELAYKMCLNSKGL